MPDISSVCEALACVTRSIDATALFTCSTPVSCSLDAAAISETISVTRLTELTISLSVWPDLLTSSVPFSTLRTESWIRFLISLAALALR